MLKDRTMSDFAEDVLAYTRVKEFIRVQGNKGFHYSHRDNKSLAEAYIKSSMRDQELRNIIKEMF